MIHSPKEFLTAVNHLKTGLFWSNNYKLYVRFCASLPSNYLPPLVALVFLFLLRFLLGFFPITLLSQRKWRNTFYLNVAWKKIMPRATGFFKRKTISYKKQTHEVVQCQLKKPHGKPIFLFALYGVSNKVRYPCKLIQYHTITAIYLSCHWVVPGNTRHHLEVTE